MTRVLVIDDHAHVRRAARALLEAAGLDVIEADGGQAGITAFRTANADLVLCDLFMPDCDGIEVLRTLNQQNPRMKLIAMSGGALGGEVDLLPVARQLGAVAVLHKPFTMRAILEAVERALAPAPASAPRP